MKVRCIETTKQNYFANAIKDEICNVINNSIIDANDKFICDLGSMLGKRCFEEVKGMTKNDLKTGMVVETRSEGRYMVIKDRLVAEVDWTTLNSFTDDLIDDAQQEEFDIVKVYGIPNCMTRLYRLQTMELELLWTRESSEVTEAKKQLEELLEKAEELKKTINGMEG